MKILQVGPADAGGGAEDVSRRLHEGYRAAGHDATLLVGRVVRGGEGVARLHQGTGLWKLVERLEDAGSWRKARAARALVTPSSALDWARGREIFHYPGTRRAIVPAAAAADIVQLHNLHGAYFDLRQLPRLTNVSEVVLNPHDMWLATGHCAYTLDSEGWLDGCSPCPYLGSYPAIRRDAAGANLRHKRALYARARVRVAAPSNWLLHRLERSILAPAIVESRVVTNGVDLDVFTPGSRVEARAELGLDPDARVILYIGHRARTSPWRDIGLFLEAVARTEATGIVVGDRAPDERVGGGTVRYAGVVTEASQLVHYLRAADVYVHPARDDTFPLAVLEALACGLPVVATPVGGIPEQVQDGETGLLADLTNLPHAVEQLLADESLRRRMSTAAASDARRRFSLRAQVTAYLDWFGEIAGRA